jgi:hypothetical protein
MKYKLPQYYPELSPNIKRKIREQYMEEQSNNCYWCHFSLNEIPPKHITDKPLNIKLFPPGMLDSPIHLQHSHKTGMTEGTVHAYCNCVMWQYENR